jgi:hypothetical protein
MQDRDFQTKSFDPCCLDYYLIEADGSLWKGACHDSEKDCLDNFRGEIHFYTFRDLWDNDAQDHGPMVNFSALYDDGKLLNLKWIGDEE